MKRPGGFDRGAPLEPVKPERPSADPAPASAAAPAPAPARQASSAGIGERADRSDLSDLIAASEPEARTEPVETDSPGERESTGAIVTDIAEHATVDLTAAGVGDDVVALPEQTGSADVRGAKQRLRLARRSKRTHERREQRRFTAHLRRRRRYWITGIAAVLGLAAFVAIGVFTPVMAVREVRIEGVQQVDVAQLQEAMSRFDGVPLALVDDQEVHAALESFSLIERYAIERIPPQTLVLRIEEREAVVAIAQEEGFALYDAAGVLIGMQTEAPAGVPVAGGEGLDPASEAFAAAGRIIRDLPEDIRAMVLGVEAASPQQVTLVLGTGTRVTWGSAEATQQKAVVLRAMTARLGAVSSIDVSAPEAPVFTQ